MRVSFPPLLRLVLIAFLPLSAAADVTTREPKPLPRVSKSEVKKATNHLWLRVEITDDGLFLVEGKPTTLAKVTRLSREIRLRDPKAKLHLIATPETNVLDMKKLVKSAAEGGITDVLFSSNGKKPAKK